MLPVLHWGSSSRFGPDKSDMNASLNIVQWIDSMRFPFSRIAWFDSPNEASFWSVHRAFQGIQWLFLYLETRFMSPQLSINVFLLLGWVSTGFVSYLIARELKLGRTISLWVGCLVEMLPVLREKLGEHHSFVWISVPLLLVLFSLQFLRDINLRRFSNCLAAWISMLFFDPHWFYFSAPCVLMCGIILIYTKWSILITYMFRNRLRMTLSICFTAIVTYLAVRKIFQLANLGSDSGIGRSYGVATTDWIDNYSGSILDYVMPSARLAAQFGGFDPGRGSDNIFYGGIIAVILFLYALISRVVFANNQRRFLLIFTLFLMILPVGSVQVFNIDLPPLSYFVRFAMPGVRVFIRTSILGQALLVVIAGVGLAHLFTMVKRRKLLLLAFALISAVSIIEMSPFSRREIYRGSEVFEEFRNVINQIDNPSVFIADGRIFGSFIKSSKYTRPDFFGVPIFNSSDSKWRLQSYSCAEAGNVEFASYLKRSEVDFVVAPLDALGRPFFDGYLQDSTKFTIFLDEQFFVEAADPVLPIEFLHNDYNGSGKLAEFDSKKVGLFRVNALHSGSCREANLAQFIATPPFRYIGDGFLSPWLYNNVLWSSQGEVSIQMETLDSSTDPENQFDFEATIIGGVFATPETLVIEVKSENQTRYLSVKSGASAHIKISVPYGDSFSLRALNCPIVNFENATSNCFGFSQYISKVME